METAPTPPPSSSSLANEADGGTIPPISVIASHPEDSTPATKLSFADAVNKGIHNKTTNKAAWNSLRSMTESREAHGLEKADPVWFTRHNHPHSVAIPYNNKTHSVNDVVEAVIKSLPNARRIDYLTTRGVVLLCFDTSEEKTACLGTTLDCLPSSLPILPTMHSAGTRLKIRAEYTPLQSGDSAKLAQDVFGSFGKIILVNQHYMHGTSIQSLSFDFVLEIDHSAPKEMVIPRVAAVDSMNVLFTWSGSKFCFRCGEGSHTKIQCPKPLDFNLSSAAALEEPIMARAFPDPDAPLREPPKKNVTFKTGPAAPKQVPNADPAWTVAGQGKNNKRGRNASSGGGITSASDSDSPHHPPRKQALHHQGSNPPPRSTPTVAQQAKTDLNAVAVLSAPSTSKADPAVAPADTEQATSSQKPAKAVEATQTSSSGDTPGQQTDLPQQETKQPPKQPAQQPAQQLISQAPAGETTTPGTNLVEDNGEPMEEDDDNVEDSSKDVDMSSKSDEARAKAKARREKNAAMKKQISGQVDPLLGVPVKSLPGKSVNSKAPKPNTPYNRPG